MFRRPQPVTLAARRLSATISANTKTIPHFLDNSLASSVVSALNNSPSAVFSHLLSCSNPAKLPLDLNPKQRMKREIAKLLSEDRYDMVIVLLKRLTRSTPFDEFQHILSHQELSHIIASLVSFQQSLIAEAGLDKMVAAEKGKGSGAAIRANETKQNIRYIYSFLISKGSDNFTHIYSHLLRAELGDVHFDFSIKDYENLITLEMANGKLDLASKWFQRLENQYPNGSHYSHMTHKLWMLRFHIYAGANPLLWLADNALQGTHNKSPRRSLFQAEKSWLDVFNEYRLHQHLTLGSSKVVFDKPLSISMIYAMGHSKQPEQLIRFIEHTYGIDSQGQLISGRSKLAKDDPQFPDLDTLQAIFVSSFHNRQYSTALAYVNAFQEHYGIDIRKRAKSLWDTMFRWAEWSTRYTKQQAFTVFLRETLGSGSRFPNLEAALKSPEFDYEGYLKFIGELHTKRYQLLSELWRRYREFDIAFSAKAYETYAKVLREEPSEKQLFRFLEELLQVRHRVGVSPDAFNKMYGRKTFSRTRELYYGTMQSLIQIKGMDEQYGQIGALVEKWALDDRMKQQLEEWTESQIRNFVANGDKRREAELERDPLDDALLGLMD